MDKKWEYFVNAANFIRAALDYKPSDIKVGYQLSPGGILNAYREGDLNFEEACRELERCGCNLQDKEYYYTPGMKFDLIIRDEVLTTYTIAGSYFDGIGLSNKGKIFLIGDHYYVYEGRFIKSNNINQITEKEFKILTQTDAGFFRKSEPKKGGE